MKKLMIMITLMCAALGQAHAGDAAYARVLDTEAMSWAWRIEKVQDMSYGDLRKMSANWGRGDELRGRLLSKVQEIINTGGARPLTVKEASSLRSALAEARGTAGARAKGADQRSLKQAAIDCAARGMLDAEAKYWAWRIAVKKDASYDGLKASSEKWLRGEEVGAELLGMVQARLQSGDTPEPGVVELKKVELGNKKIKDILSQE